MKNSINKHIKIAIVSILAIVSMGTAVIYKSSVAYAAVCPGGGQPPDGDVANCPKTTPAATNNSTSTTQSSSSGLDTTFQTGDCPKGESLIYEPGKDGPTPKCVADNVKQCGSGKNVVDVSFDFGCVGPAYGKELNPIMDIGFAIFRFLSAGVGLIVIGSIIIAGIQYSTSRGNPQATQASIKRITNAIVGLLIYIFAYAILNFIVPGGMFL